MIVLVHRQVTRLRRRGGKRKKHTGNIISIEGPERKRSHFEGMIFIQLATRRLARTPETINKRSPFKTLAHCNIAKKWCYNEP